MDYKYLNSPLNIGTMQVKNRTVMTSITMMYCEEGPDGGYVNDKLLNFYLERAKGGVGLLIAGGVATDNYVGYENMMRLNDDSYIDGIKRLADGVHRNGSKLCLQFLQTGRYGNTKAVFGDVNTLSASAVPTTFSPDVPREMTKTEIDMAITHAAEAAIRAKRADVDAIEICANSGYMISQFLSEVTNKRSDEYGGSFENRCRFGMEMIQAVRNAVGDDYPLILRVAGNQYMPGGYDLEETIEFCKLAVDAGINAIDVTGGWHETIIPQLPADVPNGAFVYLAESIKESVSVPVISSNRHNDPKEEEAVLACGQADFIGLCRTLLADPYWPNKTFEGKEHEIRKCLACNQGCFANVFNHKPCKCLFNSYVGREAEEFAIEPSKTPKNILVVGAGVAGCEFAYRAASRGHKVTIWEQTDKIGGMVNVAAIPPAKSEFHNITSYLRAMLQKYSVSVVYNKKATVDEIVHADFDEVVIAAGSTAKRIPVSVPDGISVYTAEEILKQEKIAGKNVLVIGGGSVGCETANYMAHEAAISPEKLYFLLTQQAEAPEFLAKMLTGNARNITIVDIARIGANYDFGCAWPIMKDMKRLGVKMYSKAKLLGIDEEGYHIEAFNKKTKETYVANAPVDTVVLAVGYAPKQDLVKGLEDAGKKVHNIGDSCKVGKVMDAIYVADNLAASI